MNRVMSAIKKALTSISIGIGLLTLASPSPLHAHLVIGAARKEIIGQSVFKVYGSGAPGSGVLVALPGRSVAILTSKHVIAGMGRTEEVEIEYGENKFLTVPRSKAIDVPNLDLSILPLSRERLESSSFKFHGTMLELGGINKSQKVFVAGYPVSGESISSDIRLSPGSIQVVDNKPNKDGYDIGYTSPTYVGMSGGGVFSESGKLIGIHGRGERIQSSDNNKTGTNFAVSILKVIEFVRSSKKSTRSTTASPISASRHLLFNDFNSALKEWEDLSSRYPDSLIASYNLACIREITGIETLNKNNFPLIFSKSSSSMGSLWNDYYTNKGIAFALANDPLNKIAWKQWDIKKLNETEKTAALMTVPLSIKHLQSPMERYRFNKELTPDYVQQGKCVPLATYQPVGGEVIKKFMLPFKPATFISDQEKP